MRQKSCSFVMSLMLIFLIGIFSLPTLAQKDEEILIGKKGVILFNSPVWAGDVLLKPGDYQIRHETEGADHVIVFKKMAHRRIRRGSEIGKEVARVKCKIERLGEKAEHSGLLLGSNAAGEKAVKEVHIRGENIKHVF